MSPVLSIIRWVFVVILSIQAAQCLVLAAEGTWRAFRGKSMHAREWAVVLVVLLFIVLPCVAMAWRRTW